MAKVRELTEIEKFYITNNPDKTDSQIASQISGIGVKTVEKYRDSISNNNEEADKKDTDHIAETQKERTDRLGKGQKSGEFISRREGVAIMTQEASEVSDARQIVHGYKASDEELEGRNKDTIHRPKN
tara:strand:- start:252 stop:635 length:384 start_codon:yes stop_codon:yes gene_type:complete